mmetsp:Transcript_20638/g.42438  ORF Transcript_20638/g.42438 Transcript_20638/m.42438 type:complete len:240 (-) Transcript_20638:79-798(-)
MKLSPSWHFVAFRTQSKTARSFFRMVISRSFSRNRVRYICFSLSRWALTVSQLPPFVLMSSVAATCASPDFSRLKLKRARSAVTCPKVSRFLLMNSLHSMTTSSSSPQASNIMPLRMLRAFVIDASVRGACVFFCVPCVSRTSDATSLGNFPSNRFSASSMSILLCIDDTTSRIPGPPPFSIFFTIERTEASRLELSVMFADKVARPCARKCAALAIGTLIVRIARHNFMAAIVLDFIA